jgi:hypothetical protein
VLRFRPADWARLAAGFGAFSVFAACVSPNSPGVSIKKVEANIVFGVKEPVKGPPNVEPVSEGSAVSDIGLDLSGITFPVPRLRPTVPKVPCPPAALNTFAESAADQVTHAPAAGIYRWKKNGVVKESAGSVAFDRPVRGFEQQIIQNVSPVMQDPVPRADTTPTDSAKPPPDSIFTYEVVEPDLVTSGQTVVSKYQVKTDANQLHYFPPVATPNVSTTTAPTVGPAKITLPQVPQGVGAGDPGRGLALMSVTYKDDKGNTAGTFTPQPGILLFPLEAQIFPGEVFRAGGVDPTSGATMTIDGHVIGRDRVDACGEELEGWLVQETQTISSGAAGTTVTREADYIFSTNLGGIILSEHFVAPSPTQGGAASQVPVSMPTYTLDLSIGQSKPSPVPGK